MSHRRPHDRTGLWDAIERSWQALQQQLSTLTETQLITSGSDGWSAKDHLAHLAAWEASLVALLTGRPRHEGLGVAEATYLSGDFDRINAEIQAHHQARPFAEVLHDLETAHAQLLGRISKLSPDDLQRPYAYFLPEEPGADNAQPILPLLAGETYEHYAAHLAAIRQALHLPTHLSSAEAARQLRRTDALTGCGNFLGFLEWLRSQGGQVRLNGSLLAVDLNFMAQVNAAGGHVQGDAALRWMGLVLQDETTSPVFRVGGDEFVVVLNPDSHEAHRALAQQVFARLNAEAGRVGVTSPAATLALIVYDHTAEYSPAQVWAGMDAAILDAKVNHNRALGIYAASALIPPERPRLLDSIIRSMVHIGEELDLSQKLAFSDPVTDLPNLRAALQQLEASLARAGNTGQPLGLLMIDGDDLRRYNDHGYAAGDRMLKDLGAALQASLRPGDFLARWRVGDEFLVLLPDTSLTAALGVGERLCETVRTASLDWLYPISISIGLAVYPEHARTQDALISAAEDAKDRAKAQGKDRVVAATPNP